MIKSILEKNILLNNMNIFKKHVKMAPICILISILPFLCSWGNLHMLHAVETKIPKIESLSNKELFIRMSLVSDNYEITNYLIHKNCMEASLCLRYYICSGGSDIRMYNLFDTVDNWSCVTNTDIINGIRNGTLKTLEYLHTKIKIPAYNYHKLSIEKQVFLLRNNDVLNYYMANMINNELVLNELYERKKRNMNFLKSIIYLKIFLIRIILYQINIIL